MSLTVAEGDSATFNCTITDSTDALDWIIDGSYYSSEGLPPRHSYLNSMLTVSNVNVSDNGTTYQCVLIPFESDVATLTVVPKGL